MSSDIASVNIDKLREEIKALRNEIARLNNQTNWVCKCGGTDTEGQKELEEQAVLLGKGAEREARLLGRIGELQKENASLRDDYLDMGRTALKWETLAYIEAQILTDQQREIRDAIQDEVKLNKLTCWASIHAVCGMVMKRYEEGKQ